MNQDVIFVVKFQAVNNSSKVNWPDMNYPGTGQTVLRYLHEIDFEKLRVKLDGEDSPWIEKKNLPPGVGFFKRM